MAAEPKPIQVLKEANPAADLALVVGPENVKLYASREVLSAASPVLSRLITEDSQQKVEGSKNILEVNLLNENPTAITDLCKVHLGIQNLELGRSSDIDRILALTALATKYQCNRGEHFRKSVEVWLLVCLEDLERRNDLQHGSSYHVSDVDYLSKVSSAGFSIDSRIILPVVSRKIIKCGAYHDIYTAGGMTMKCMPFGHDGGY